MGKKPNWFRRIFAGTKNKTTIESTKHTLIYQNQWSSSSPYSASNTMDASKHAIVVAAATAAVAEAAVAAAKAAVEVVRLTSGRGGCTPMAYVSGYWEVVSAVKIQSLFRGYLARRALRALKALVKLQALVRGHIVRKNTADTLRRMQALVRVQGRARASRAYMSKSSQTSNKSSQSPHLGSANPIKYEHQIRTNSTKFHQPSKAKSNGLNPISRDIDLDRVHYGAKWLDHWMKENSLKSQADDKETHKILEIDNWKPHSNSIQRNIISPKSHVLPPNYYDALFMPFHSLSSKPKNGDSTSVNSLKHLNEKDEATSWTAETSPQLFSASSRPGTSTGRSVFSPTKSEYLRSVFNGYADHPNYMSYTESYRSKVRSQSTPRLRMELEKYGSTRRSSVHGFSNTRV